MSRAIKVDDKVYQELDLLRGEGQTFSQVIKNMLIARIETFKVLSIMEGRLKYREWQRKELDALIMARAERADLDARTLKE